MAHDDATHNHAMPELAAACRVLLGTVGLSGRWTDHGPDAQARAWLSAGDCAEARPAELTPDQWTMLRLCVSLWNSVGGPRADEVLMLGAGAKVAFATFLLMDAATDDAPARWSRAMSAFGNNEVDTWRLSL